MSILRFRNAEGNVQEILAIRGKDGKDGVTPEKGVDYFTEEDKAEMVEAVLTDLPIATETTLGGVTVAPKTEDMNQPVGADESGKLWIEPSKVDPMPKTDEMTQPVGMDERGSLWTLPSGGGGSYELPIATPETLGGVKPVAKTDEMSVPVGVDTNGGMWTYDGRVNPMLKTDEMTQPVGVDEGGGLWTLPSGGGSGGGETKTKFITVVDVTLENDVVIGGENDDISFGDAVVGKRHFFYKTPEGEQLKAKRIWGYLQPSADFNGSGFGMSAYYADGTPKDWNFGDLVGNNTGIIGFPFNNNVGANQFWEFAISSDLKLCQSFVVKQRSWTGDISYTSAIPYISLDTEIPHISGFKISSTSSHTIPAGSRFILSAEVEDNA